MEANERALLELFRGDIRYEMPPSQREYVWDLRSRWEPLWDDIRATAENHLQGRSRAHFLGPLAVKEITENDRVAGDVITKSVIDGQQRLTTLQLILHAAQAVTQKYDRPTADALRPYVENSHTSWPSGSQDYQYKIWSKASESNRAGFVQAMGEDDTSQQTITQHDDSPIVNAHRFFIRHIDGWINSVASGQQKRYCESLRHTLLGLIRVIVIDIEENDDARLIYETLNARGTPLLQSELIKNRLMDEKVAEYGQWPFDDDWWRGVPEQEQQRRNRSDILLQHWVTMRGKKFVHQHGSFRGI